MTLVKEYVDARRGEDLLRLRRVLALRGLMASGRTQSSVGVELGISQSAVSQQLGAARDLSSVAPADLLHAAAPVLREVAHAHGYDHLAVFGSIARGEARPDSDIDLLVRAPQGTSTFDFLRFKSILEQVLGREIDLVDEGGLREGRDDDVLRDAVRL